LLAINFFKTRQDILMDLFIPGNQHRLFLPKTHSRSKPLSVEQIAPALMAISAPAIFYSEATLTSSQASYRPSAILAAWSKPPK